MAADGGCLHVTPATGFQHLSACTGNRKELCADFQACPRLPACTLACPTHTLHAISQHAGGSSGPWEQRERGQVPLCLHRIL